MSSDSQIIGYLLVAAVLFFVFKKLREGYKEGSGLAPAAAAPGKTSGGISKMMRWGFIIFAGLVVTMCAISQKSGKDSLQAVATGASDAAPMAPQQKIAADAVEAYTKANNPKMHKAWGDAGLKRLNELAPKAALAVAGHHKCDRVEVVGLSFDRSNPPKEAVFFADCANKERFYVTENEINSGIATAPESARARTASGKPMVDDGQAIRLCEQAVKAQLNHPATFDRKRLDTVVTRPKQSVNSVVYFGFTAKNSLGAELPHKARCIVQPDGTTEASISN